MFHKLMYLSLLNVCFVIGFLPLGCNPPKRESENDNLHPMHQAAVATAFLSGRGLLCKPIRVECSHIDTSQYLVIFSSITNSTVSASNNLFISSYTKVCIVDDIIQFAEQPLKVAELTPNERAIEQAVIVATTLLASKGVNYEQYDLYPSINEVGAVTVYFERIPRFLGEHCLVFQRRGKVFFNAGL